MSTGYDINYDDQRFKDVEADKKAAISENEKLYSGMIDETKGYYQAQVNATKEWEKKQTELQQQKTDFAIDQIEQQKEQAKKDYTKEQSGAYADWKKQSNEYGANAEKEAEMGMSNTGFSESAQVSMYNAYQQRVMAAKESLDRIMQNYNNGITEAKLQGNALLAEIHFNSLQKQLELNLAGFQQQNQLLLQKADQKMQIDQMYHERWQDVLGQINAENALAEEIRQFNESMALEREQWEFQKAKASGGGGGGGSRGGSRGGSGGGGGGGGGTITKTSTAAKGAVSGAITGAKSTAGKASGASVNLESVIKSGLGPASGTTIAKAVKSGKVTATQKNGQVYISPNKKNVTGNLLFSKKRF